MAKLVGKIDNEGVLKIRRMRIGKPVMLKMYCSEDGESYCYDSCVFFGEPKLIKQKTYPDYYTLDTCRRPLIFDLLTDERLEVK